MSDLTDLLRATADDRLPDKRDRLYDLADRLDAEIRQVKAGAWDEGHAAHDQGYLQDSNPYREGP